MAFLTSFAAFPWVVKPLYGFLSDTVPIFGYRRRSYLIICGLLGAPGHPSCAQHSYKRCSAVAQHENLMQYQHHRAALANATLQTASCPF